MAEDNTTPRSPGAEAQGSQPANEAASQNAGQPRAGEQGAGQAGDGQTAQSSAGAGGGAASVAGQSPQPSSQQQAGASSGTASAGQAGAGQDQGAKEGTSSGRSAGADLSDFSSEAQEGTALGQSGVAKEREREAILDVPVKITAVVGDVKMPVRDLVRLGRGAVVPLNRKLGSSIDIYANDRLIARGEITIIEDDNIAVTMTEIMSSSSST